MSMEPDDLEKARMILEHIRRLRELGDFAGEDTTEAEEKFISLMLRNERAGALKKQAKDR